MMKLIELLREDSRTPAVVMIVAVLTSAYILVDQAITVHDAIDQASYGLAAYKTVLSNVVEIGGCLLAACRAKPAVDSAGGLIEAIRSDWRALH